VGSGIPLLDAVRMFEKAGCSSFIYTDVSRDGTMSGPNVEALIRLADETDLPLIASGGISNLDDLKTVARLEPLGVTGAIVGRALYEHKFTIGEAMLAADEAAAGRDEPPLVEPRG
jgi:phosphoribosylformimino-5-aminoimidazole carboxamide ribonucleotide (ProFAR) isomerase